MLTTHLQRFSTGERLRETRLRNGLTVASLRMPYANTVAVGVWIPFGIKHERRGERGWTHLLEHLVFKGTESHEPKQLRLLLDRMLEWDAFVDIESTFFRIVAAPQSVDEIVPLLYELFALSAFDDRDVNTERKVVISEQDGETDDPSEYAWELARRAVFAGSSHANRIHGAKEDLALATAARLHNLRRRGWTTAGSYVIATGDVLHHKLLRLVNDTFGTMARTNPRGSGDRGEAHPRARISAASRERIRQSHVVHAFLIPPAAHEDHIALQILGAHLASAGGPLMEELRFRHGAVYDVTCQVESARRYGDLTVRTATRAHDTARVNLLVHRLTRAAASTIDEARLEELKDNLVARLGYALETPKSILTDWAESLTRYRRFMHFTEQAARLRDVTLDDIRRVADEHLFRPTVSVVGVPTAVADLRRSERAWTRELTALLAQEAEAAEEDDEDEAA